jgi:hypothetical protein
MRNRVFLTTAAIFSIAVGVMIPLAKASDKGGSNVGESVLVSQGKEGGAQAASSALAVASSEAFGSRYAGEWASEDDSSITVGVKGPIEDGDIEALSKIAPEGPSTWIAPTRYSRDEIVEFVDKLTTSQIEGVTSIGPDYRSNQIIVTAMKDDGLSAQLDEIVPADSFVIRVDAQGNWVAGEAREDYPPYKAGRTLYIPSGPVFCTGGFTMVLNGSGLKQGSTAGHCSPDNRFVNSGGAPSWPDTVGVTNTNVFFASTPAFGDVQLIGFSDQDDARRKVYENDTVTRLVTTKFSTIGLTIGTSLCLSGRGTGISCGVVTQEYPNSICENYDPGQPCKNVGHLVFSNLTCRGGDSGGPVYQRIGTDNAKAAGGIVAFFSDGPPYGPCAFDPIHNIEINTDTLVWKT